ncbi:hypothetical protein Btru_075392 [Bulinus truncatus]|nr:hypothetical protein Btru_075392 [Bulinus truncatus]
MAVLTGPRSHGCAHGPQKSCFWSRAPEVMAVVASPRSHGCGRGPPEIMAVVAGPRSHVCGHRPQKSAVWPDRRQLGVNDASNVSFLILATSDLFSLITGLVFDVCFNVSTYPLSDFITDPLTMTYIIIVIPRNIFSRMTCCTTVFITIERCMCIASPLKVRNILSTDRTLVVLGSFFIACATLNLSHLCVGSFYIESLFDPFLNVSIAGIRLSPNYIGVGLIMGSLNSMAFVALFVVIVISTAVLTSELNKKSKRRKSLASDETNLQALSKRDKSVSKIVILLSSCLILTYLPFTAFCLLSTVITDFTTRWKYEDVFRILLMLCYIFENINSSSSIFIYYKMSSQYRLNFQIMFFKKIGLVVKSIFRKI